jgi:hypothetical protein
LSTELLLRCLNGATFDTMYRPVDHDCLGQGFRLLAREHLFGWAHSAALLLHSVPVSASDAWRTSGWGIMGESLFRLAIAI